MASASRPSVNVHSMFFPTIHLFFRADIFLGNLGREEKLGRLGGKEGRLGRKVGKEGDGKLGGKKIRGYASLCGRKVPLGPPKRAFHVNSP